MQIFQLKHVLIGFLALTWLSACVVDENTRGISQDDVLPFGTNEEITYAEELWRVMEAERMVGENEVRLEPFFAGAKPHGKILELVYRNIKVNNHVGFVIVKKNYDGENATVESVKSNRSKYLSSITIMYQRESGYDEENLDWFWAKYNPDGGLFQKKVAGKLTQFAGKIWKGKTVDENKACIYCHRSARDGDYIFYPEIQIPN